MSSVHANEGVQKPVDPKVLTLGRVNGWLRHATEARRIDEEPDSYGGGVRTYADKVDFVPGVTRTKAEIAARAEELYGPARNPHAHS